MLGTASGRANHLFSSRRHCRYDRRNRHNKSALVAAIAHHKNAAQIIRIEVNLDHPANDTARSFVAKPAALLSSLIANRPRKELTYRIIADPAVGYRFYISSRWGEPKIDGNTITLRLKTGGVAWITLEPYTREDDKSLRARIKSPDPALASNEIAAMKEQFGDARLLKHGPSDGSLTGRYYIMAEIPADQQYRKRGSLAFLSPGVDRLVTLQFVTFADKVDSEVGDFIGLAETYSYTPPALTKTAERVLGEIESRK